MRKKIIIILKYFLFYSILALFVFFILLFSGKRIIGGIIKKLNNSARGNVHEYIKLGFEDAFIQFNSVGEKEVYSDSVKNLMTDDEKSIVVNLSATSGKYKNFGGTSVINNTDYNVESLLYSAFEPPTAKNNEPYVLIYHTHTSEKYNGGGTVVDVGREMALYFEKCGYKTIHLTDSFDNEQFSGAYSRSAVAVESILKKYPTIKLVFDVHRDAITDSSGKEYRPVTYVNEKPVAQVMFVCGTDEKGLTHPDWRENFKFALGVSRTINKLYDGLSRPVNLRGDRFNTHFTKHSFIIEVGSEANTLEEVKSAAVFTVKSIIKTIEG